MPSDVSDCLENLDTPATSRAFRQEWLVLRMGQIREWIGQIIIEIHLASKYERNIPEARHAVKDILTM